MKEKGQSTIEYTLLMTAVVAVIITLTTGSSSLFQKKLTNTVNMTLSGMEKEAQKLTNSMTN